MNNLEINHEKSTEDQQQVLCSDVPEEQGAPIQAQELQSHPKNLTGFAKGWVMFMIIAHFAAIGAQLQNIHEPVIIMFALFVSVMIIGFVLLYYRKPYGLYITAVSNTLALIIMNNAFGNGVNLRGSIIFVIITFFVTKKQLKYF
ncbi:MAG: hypothetical protein V2B20_24380 [Pseudomonadota bacterium]